MIENAKKEDLTDIYDLICELEQEQISKDFFMRTYLDGLDNKDIYYIVYRHEDKIIAFMSLYIHYYLHHHDVTGEIVELIVLPEYRGLKVGHRLIEYAEKLAKEKGLVELELSTSTYRKKAHLFYEAHGFVRDHYNYTKDI